ncbi:MAG TPA: hypothetical protein VJT71_16650 [Pyrinomonadaceae bacterium]|nr:hypothetical protein [Pyrinomonadaceae bacterium]
MQPNVKATFREVTDALAELGLTPDILNDAILRGETARDSCTANDPPNAPGFYSWAGTVRALRDILVPLGWVRNDDVNYSRIVNEVLNIAIAVVTGDEATGNRDFSPKTKYPKGPATQAAVTLNQDSLFGSSSAPTEGETENNRITWMLLRKRNGDTVYAELSLPSLMSKDGQVERWESRIILEPMTFDPLIDVGEDSSEPPIDVLVRRRS